ncbi:MAG: ATP synthase F1 subunit gamma [Syntrophales bacterium]|jgi:F-type H+-transporting ATPase subunit gamma|nr:ATP synthase F1 subunit gamma [Syntrophales bacterium]MCK9528132.1 ATP synthase F1 subunit gamma [Syntrophales bacterium]MDX9921101.1 ATP synthase F1 subunit gamma [Syntrophales bacterium]
MAESLRDIKRKAQAVEKTKQITRAMNMVAASKLKSAQTRMENFRPYARKVMEVLNSLSSQMSGISNPLLAVREPKRAKLIVMTSDRGLCGGFNTNVIKAAEGFIKYHRNEGKELALVTVGKKARDYFRRKETVTNQYVDVLANFNMELAVALGADVIGPFEEAEYDELFIAYNEFRNIASQRPKIVRLLPLAAEEPAESDVFGDYIYEPSDEVLFAQIVPMYIRVQIFNGLLETSAGEHGARMVAMENATSSCEEMIETLTLKFNKARQAAITTELMDIVGGTEALAKSS